jgi:hypothetical protein
MLRSNTPRMLRALLLVAGLYGALVSLQAYAQSDWPADADPRDEVRTFVSFPEWYIVYSAEEYADFVEQGGRPSAFPYFAAIRQYWQSVRFSKEAAGEGVVIDPATQSVLRFVGASFSAEYSLIGVYENLFGRLTEISNLGFKTTEDLYTDRVAREYGAFLLHTPWYRFPYFQKLAGLWQTYGWSSLTVRGLERRAIFTFAYTAKGLYGKVIRKITESAYTPAGLTTRFTTANISPEQLASIPNVTVVQALKNGRIEAEAPRYRAFTAVAAAIMLRDGTFVGIQGNTRIMTTALIPLDGWCLETQERTPAFAIPVLTRDDVRAAYVIPVADLHLLAEDLAACGVVLEHIYDY